MLHSSLHKLVKAVYIPDKIQVEGSRFPRELALRQPTNITGMPEPPEDPSISLRPVRWTRMSCIISKILNPVYRVYPALYGMSSQLFPYWCLPRKAKPLSTWVPRAEGIIWDDHRDLYYMLLATAYTMYVSTVLHFRSHHPKIAL